ncbi:MAG: aminomethyl-transferring glycine dehydrogenase subunit GcvPA [Kiritimatiellia bacterium]|nr:aminomethyl-transferring glycine dehydrogenase subunit GcvPA [Lentisphaerota bacterium]
MSATGFQCISPEEAASMLRELGCADFDQLFREIPANLQHNRFDLPPGISEMEMLRRTGELAGRNAAHRVNFCGGGFYDHFIPSALDALAGRAEFYTAYTPYQPEVSQGTLQAIYEYQSSICRLTGMSTANASLYDGGTAIFEAIMMAFRITRRKRVLIDTGVNPIYRSMLKCLSANLDFEFREVPHADGRADRAALRQLIDKDTAGVILQNPNFFGTLDDFSDIIQQSHDAGALGIVSVYPISLGMVRTPAEMGADIVTGEGQSLGLPLSFGGPYLGFMATQTRHVHKMPGRLAGATIDQHGQRGFVLTLQAREQHIRREKATSNICSNEALCALRALIYLCLLGKSGLAETAEICAANAAYARSKTTAITGVKPTFDHEYFNEFALTLPVNAADVVSALIEKGFAAGFPVGRYYPGMDNVLLVACTEKHTKEDIDMFAAALEAAL